SSSILQDRGLGSGITTTNISWIRAGAVSVGDFDNDGQADILMGVGAQADSGTFLILFNKGDGTFSYTRLGLDGGVTSVAVGDFNGDGRIDFAGTISLGAFVCVDINNGDRTFRQIATLVDDRPRFVRVGDFNGDGKLDLVTAETNFNTI